MKRKLSSLLFVGMVWLSIPACAPDGEKTKAVMSDSYEDLIRAFREWREFQKPEVIDGVPDYSAPAMAKQARELPSYKNRLVAINPATWPVPQQVDYRFKTNTLWLALPGGKHRLDGYENLPAPARLWSELHRG